MARGSRPVDRLEVIAPQRARHWDAILDLTAKAFAHRRYWNWLAYCSAGYIADSPYDWQASRIGLLDGAVVTHFGIWDHWLRIGGATVRVAGVGAVATDGTYYRQGLMARTATACLEGLSGYGYHLTMLHGIPDFYHRFGYVRAWPDSETWVEVSALPKPNRRPALRRFEGDRAPLDALHNRQNRSLAGTAVRPTYRRNRRPEEWHTWVWGPPRLPRGYVVVASPEDGLHLIDHAGPAGEVLEAVVHLAQREGHRRVRFSSLHHRSELARALRACACRVELRYQGSGGWMVRTLDLAGVLRRMAGELGRRLQRSGLGDWEGELLIQDPRERVLLVASGSKLRVCPAERAAPRNAIRGGEEIAQLLVGSDEPEEVVEAGGIRLSGDATFLVRALFPAQQPCLPAWDHY